ALVQHVESAGRDPAGDHAGRGIHGMGWADRGSPGRLKAIGTVGQGRDLLQVFGAYLVPHLRPPSSDPRQHPPTLPADHRGRDR
ncbi:MAG TPA: hypothetical protein VJU61_27400, partial [Polyangiaceae bacterium]|nr:hypothetical protein [Polyangiaceae bacterium]